MLDENLPSFQFRQSQDNPLSSPIYFSQNGSEPAPEFIFERAHPSTNPAAARKYAVALKDPYHTDVVYAEVVVSPTWQQPTLSAAEVRAQQGQNNGARLQPTPLIPDTFTIQLYDPDQTVIVRYVPSSLTRTDSFEFEMLSQGFKMPSSSQLDRQNTEPRADFRPRIMFKWKRDSRLSKDMTCYNVGKSLGKHKSKEPDITVALFKMSRDTAITVYEPNLQRVEMEDRKGLDIVLVIGAEVIRDLWLAPEKRPDLFNIGTGVPVAMANGKRKNSRPSPPPAGMAAPKPGAIARPPTNGPPPAMSGALGPTPSTASTANVPPAYSSKDTAAAPAYSLRPKDAAVDAETERLRKMVDEEKRRARQEAAEREKRDREEAKRIEKMLKMEENEKRRRQAEVDQETERLRKLYGTQGQDMPPTRPPPQVTNIGLPPRQQQQQPQQRPVVSFAGPPQRPLSVGPGTAPSSYPSLTNFFNRPSAPPQQPGPTGSSGRPCGRLSQGPYQSGNPIAAVSGFFQNVLDPKKKPVTKKKSMHW